MREEEYTIPKMVDDVRAGTLQRRHFIKQLRLMGLSAVDTIVAAAAARQFASTPVP